jgi:hypothetical protein
VAVEVIQHKIIKAPVPEGKVVHRVRFHSDYTDCRPVEAHWPWPHPWWCTGTYGDKVEGCIIVAYAEDVQLISKAWPEARDIEIFESGLTHYTFTDRFQPPDEWVEKFSPKVWGQWAHCGPAHRWQLILREAEEANQQIESATSAELELPEEPPKPDDFLLWWMNQAECTDMAHREDEGGLSDWPKYLTSEIRSMYGRPLRGRLWVAPEHMKICPNVPQPFCHRIDDSKGGIAFLRKDLEFVRKAPGVITDLRMNQLEERTFLNNGVSITKF